MGYTLQRLAQTGELGYISKHNSNYAVIEGALNAILTQLTGSSSGATSLPAVLTVLFGADPAVVGAASYQTTIAGLKLNVAGGSAWLPGMGAVVSSGATVQLDLTAAADGTYYVSADNLGVPLFRASSTDALYSVVKSGGALSSLTRVAKVAWAFSDWLAAQSSSALGPFTSLDARLEAIEAAGAPDLSGYQPTSAKGQANGYASLGADGRVPVAQLPVQPVMVPYFAGGKPGDGSLLHAFLPSETVSFPSGLAGSRARASVAATAIAVISIQKNGVEVGTLTFGAGATVGEFAAAADFTVGAADELSFVNQATADATLAGLRFTLTGTREA